MAGSRLERASVLSGIGGLGMGPSVDWRWIANASVRQGNFIVSKLPFENIYRQGIAYRGAWRHRRLDSDLDERRDAERRCWPTLRIRLADGVQDILASVLQSDLIILSSGRGHIHSVSE